MNILFLADELSQYFLDCLEVLYSHYNCDITLVRRPVSDSFPLELQISEGISDHVLPFGHPIPGAAIEQEFDLVFCSGWRCKKYIQACSRMKSHCPVILGFDNWFKGGLKQTIGLLYFRSVLRNAFSHAWVPGCRQYVLAKKMGFAYERTRTGLYTADLRRFEEAARTPINCDQKELVFIGRLVKYKNSKLLYDVFHSLSDEERNGWLLKIYGSGPESNLMPQTSRCKLEGFIQPKSVPNSIAKSTACIIPSNGESWGVALHEYVASGRPVISSEQVGASEAFVINEANGFTFDAESRETLRKSLVRLFSLSNQKLTDFGKKSYELSRSNSTFIWSERFLSFRQNK